jgi:glucose/arabinose dehydrogenase
VTGIPAGAGNRHLGCRLEIGPDQMLWITTGDAVQPQAPQDVRSRAGKVLRATLAGGPAPDSPRDRWDPYVYTRGHRNPQGLAFAPGDGTPYAVEHGTGCDDEVNLLTAGGNYGWDPIGSGGGYAEDAPMTAPGIEGAIDAVWSSGCPTIAPSGADFITGARWGQWAGQLAVAVLKDRQLMFVRLGDGRVTEVATFLTGALGRLRTVRSGPDGSLWVTVDASPGAVVRLVPAG